MTKKHDSLKPSAALPAVLSPKIELNHLKYFYYTVLEGGVSQAANRICVQQPVVSKMLKTLEEDLGEALFWKDGRSKKLTNYGQFVFRHCQVIFDEISKIKQFSNDPKQITGTLNIGAAEPIVNYLLGDVVTEMIEEFPKLNLTVYSSTQSHLLQMISDGQLEEGCFFYIPKLPAGLEIIESIPIRFQVVIKTSKQKDQNTLEFFIGSREIDDPSSHDFPTLKLLKKNHPKTDIKFSTNSISLHKSLVLKGKGISVMPSFMIEKELKKGQLTDLLPTKTLKWDLMLVKRKTGDLSIPAQSFTNKIKGLSNTK